MYELSTQHAKIVQANQLAKRAIKSTIHYCISKKTNAQQKTKSTSQGTNIGANTSALTSKNNVILATAIVAVLSKDNEKIAMRVDQGSQATFQ